MADWSELLIQLIKLSNYPVLKDNGKITALEAKTKAEAEYDVFRIRQDHEYVSDFDELLKHSKIKV